MKNIVVIFGQKNDVVVRNGSKSLVIVFSL